MNSIRSYLISVVTGSLASLSIVGVASADVSPPQIEETERLRDTISVTVYRPDLFCETLLPETVDVPTTAPLEGAVGHILKDWAQGEFRIAGYRTARDNATGTVTIDLRVAPDAPRQWTALSTCEQFALFGSLRTTLMQNTALQTNDVLFTSQGEALEF
ncbi:MAG: sporulation/spore germination protein [Cyanobacteria bacterium SID2]|nr:sporulation/spore germination protein [Cyanobacteria bacterium SID2]MBP0005936.1 sporulation/spore germination protein [Cyanobacteria bacterium SBC]